MGVYSLNRTNLNTIAQVEAEPYSGFVGCYEAMIDMEHNNHVIFEALIQNDFKEAAYVNEGNLEQAQIVNEASIAGIKIMFCGNFIYNLIIICLFEDCMKFKYFLYVFLVL